MNEKQYYIKMRNKYAELVMNNPQHVLENRRIMLWYHDAALKCIENNVERNHHQLWLENFYNKRLVKFYANLRIIDEELNQIKDERIRILQERVSELYDNCLVLKRDIEARDWLINLLLSTKEEK